MDAETNNELSQSKQLQEILKCTQCIKDIFAEVPGGDRDYIVGKAYMHEAADCIENAPGKTLRLMRKAQEAIEAEYNIIVRLQEVRVRRTSVPDYSFSDEEEELENEIAGSVKKGNWKKALVPLAKLEAISFAGTKEAIEIGTEIAIEDRSLVANRPTTVNLIIVNGSAFTMKIINMTGSPDKQVSIFNEYRKSIVPGGQLTVRMNVIGLVEGDMIVEVKTDVEVEGKRTTLVKQTSLKVDAQPSVVTNTALREEVPCIRQANGTMQNPPARTPQPAVQGGGANPVSMILDASPQDWVDLISYDMANSIAFDLSGLQSITEYQLKKGYRSLLQSLIVQNYENPMNWSIWFSDTDKNNRKGVIGDEFARRVAPLIFEMNSSRERKVEFENDGGVGSSNKDKFTAVLHIASGTIGLPKEKLLGIRSWDFKVPMASGDIEVCVERGTIKDEKGKNLKYVFRRTR